MTDRPKMRPLTPKPSGSSTLSLRDETHTEMRQRIEEEERIRHEVRQRLETRHTPSPGPASTGAPIIINNLIHPPAQAVPSASRPARGVLVELLYFLFIGWWLGLLRLGMSLLGIGLILLALLVSLPVLYAVLKSLFRLL